MNVIMLSALMTNFGFIVFGINFGGNILTFIDMPSIIILLVPTYLSVAAAYDLDSALATLKGIAIDPEPKDAAALALVSECYGRQLLAFAWVATFIGAINMLSQIDDPSVIAPATAVLLLCPLYAASMRAVVFLPLTDKFNRLAKSA